MRTTIIFDMDGLMVDTEPLSRRAWGEVLAEHDRTLSDELYLRMIGHRTLDSARIVLADHPIPYTPEELAARKTVQFATIRAQGVPVMPGLPELQAEIARRGLRWAVATSSPRAQAEEILDRLGLLADCSTIAGGDEVVQGKPAPDIYLLAAERLGVLPGECLALEDSAPGCRAAIAAGMLVAAIPNGYTTNSDFSFVPAVYPSLHAVRQDLEWLLVAGRW
jgi:HAD superfamily hydrolase (TIGR01509 family)